MTVKPETGFIASIHKHLPPRRQLHWEKTNNPYSSGTADVWYSGWLDDLWVEYKYLATFPVRDRKLIPKLSPLQLQWVTRRHDEGRNVIVIQGFHSGGVIYKIPDLLKGLDIQQLTDRLLSRKELAATINLHCNGHKFDETQP